MKHIAAIALAACSLLASAQGVTTNLTVYTDIHTPPNTSHYFATRIALCIRDGLVVECRDEGVFDLFNGKAATESLKDIAAKLEEDRARREARQRQRDELTRTLDELRAQRDALKERRRGGGVPDGAHKAEGGAAPATGDRGAAPVRASP